MGTLSWRLPPKKMLKSMVGDGAEIDVAGWKFSTVSRFRKRCLFPRGVLFNVDVGLECCWSVFNQH